MQRAIPLAAIVSLVLLSILIAPAPAQAQKKKAAGPTAPSTQPVADARQALATARSKATEADAALSTLLVKLRKDQENSPELTAALAALKQAQQAYEAAAKPVFGKLAQTPAYQATVKQRDSLKERSAAAAGTEQAAAAGQQLLEADTAVTKLEREALTYDTAVATAKAALGKAQAELSAVRAKLDASFKDNPEYQAARQALEAAQQQVAAAEKALPQAQQQYAADLAAYQAAEAEYKRQQEIEQARRDHNTVIIRNNGRVRRN